LDSDGKPEKKYVQIKISNLEKDNQLRKIIQMIDVSSTILYVQEHAQTSFLSLINACVSHELRNPLNSIIA
jgi:signal transduction histidine kinase